MTRGIRLQFLGFACVLVLASGAWADAPPVPNREELLRPYPNPAWSGFNLSGHDTLKIEEGLYTFQRFGTRNFFLVTKEGVALTDPINPESAKIMREEIRKVTDKPVTHVIYSHNHWDHARGGQIFKDEGATFVAHEACRRHFVQRPHPEVVMPDVTFGGNYTLLVGGERIELLYYGRNHSDCLVFMRLRGGRYMFIVDVVSPGAVPWGIVPDTDYLGTIQTIEELEKLEFEAIIPGHAAPLAHPSALTERRLYLEALMSATEAELRDAALDAGFFDRIKGRLAEFRYLRGFEMHGKDNINSMLYYVGIGE